MVARVCADRRDYCSVQQAITLPPSPERTRPGPSALRAWPEPVPKYTNPQEVIVKLITVYTAPSRDILPLRRLRYERRLTIKELSEITGLSPNTIYRLETGGRTNPSKGTLKTLADLYGLTPEEISEMVPPPPPPRKAIREIRDEKGITGQNLARMAGIS